MSRDTQSLEEAFAAVFGEGKGLLYTDDKTLNQLYDEIIHPNVQGVKKRRDLDKIQEDLNDIYRDMIVEKKTQEAKKLSDFAQSVITASRGCNICGGALVKIRGRYPKLPERIVCPTCLASRLDDIAQMANITYGQTYQELK
jgi:thiamine pyrophosphokinase